MASKHSRTDRRWYFLLGIALASMLSMLGLLDAPGPSGRVADDASDASMMLAQYSRCPGGRCPP